MTSLPPTSVPDVFSDYRTDWPARTPDLSRQKFPDELILLTDGVTEFSKAPVDDAVFGTPPKCFSDAEARKTKYLWVVSPETIPYILENGDIGTQLQRKSVSHTNLTGGKDAHCGGELWFRDETTFWLCGGSSRYKARCAEELEAVATSFRKMGYDVINMGWDEETNSPIRLLRV